MSVTAARGFTAAGISAGIKASGALDLALVAAEPVSPLASAAVFTSNKAVAAPVVVSRQHFAASGGRVGAVVLNSGGANAATGEQGIGVARRTSRLAAEALGLEDEAVLVCSTGLIGTQLPPEAFERGIPQLVAARSGTAEAGHAAALAIMTTDTRPKEAVARREGFAVGGMCKGAGMIAPNMATMLAVVTTDARAGAAELDRALRRAVEVSFNAISIDGCMSTNDTVVLLSSGLGTEPVDGEELTAAVTEVCAELARAIVADAEGGTKVVHVVVSGAADDGAARAAARAIADCNLAKCSWFGEDPNWGRIVAAAGACGAPFELERVSVAYGGVAVCAGGGPVPHDAEAVARHLHEPEIEVRCDLGLGAGHAEMLSADLTHGYVDENTGAS